MKDKRQLPVTVLAIILTMPLLLGSCASQKKITYIRDMEVSLGYPLGERHEAHVQPGDLIDIAVTCRNPELAIPFNTASGSITVDAEGNITRNSSQGGSNGYRVDVDGDIDFPILGKLHVEGLTSREVSDLIREGIVEGNYIKDPLVTMEFLNFKYSVLGAVNSNGTYTVEGERITLLEAIARAGDLTKAARIDRVGVLREEGDQRTLYMHDLRSKDIFNSPCFYLQQNDIIYVAPRYRSKDREERGWQIASFMTTLASLVATFIWATK